MLVIDNGDLTRMWTLTLSGAMAWRSVPAPADGPPHLSGSGTTIDPEGRRVFFASGVGFGPHGSASAHHELWAFDLDVGQWSQLASDGIPERVLPLMTFDETDNGLLFHGGYDYGASLLNHDLWLFSFMPNETVTSSEVTPPDVPYGGLTGKAFLRDSRRHRSLLIGSPANALWQPNLGTPWTWTQIPTTNQPALPSVATAVVYDSLADQIVFGNPAGVWSLPLASSNWARIWKSDYTPPPTMILAPMVFDPVGNRAWLLSASTGNPMNSWAIDFDDPNPTWRAMSTQGTPPVGGPAQFAAYDHRRDRIVLLTYYGEYALSLGTLTWSRMTVDGTRPPFLGDSDEHDRAILDDGNDRIVLTLVRDQSALGQTQTWALSFADPATWTKLDVQVPRPNVLDLGPMIYDAASERLVGLILTRFSNGTTNFDSLQVWQLSMEDGAEWQLLDSSPLSPNLRGESAVYDAARRRMVVFGGRTSLDVGDWSNEVHAYDLREPRSWTTLTPNDPKPLPRADHAVAYDPLADRMIIFGGVGYSDTWYLNWGSPTIPSAACLEPAIWSTTGQTVHYSVTNPTMVPQLVDVRVSNERDWPGFPLTTRREIAPGTNDVALSFAAPDTAGPGRTRFTLSVALAGLGQSTCEQEWLDASAGSGLALLPPTATPDGVRISWSGTTNLEIAVERKDESAWVRLAEFRSGITSYVDHSAIPGHVYLYRLVLRGPQGEQASGAVRALTPVALGLAIRPIQPLAEPRFVISLSHSGPASLDLFDLVGRRVAHLDLSHLQAGENVVTFSGEQLRSGMYVAKLEQDGVVKTSRCVVLR
jgi:hypothetical protein